MGNVHVSSVGSDCLILLEKLYWGQLQLHAEYYALRICVTFYFLVYIQP